MPVRCPHHLCHQLMCEWAIGSDFNLTFTCRRGHKFIATPDGCFLIDKSKQPMVA